MSIWNVLKSVIGTTMTGGVGSAATGYVQGGLNHSGYGPGDSIGTYRSLPSATFAAADRLHTGVGPGERPAVIRNDESVLTPGQMRQLAPASSDASGGGNQTLTFNIDARGAQKGVGEEIKAAITEAIDNNNRFKVPQMIHNAKGKTMLETGKAA